MTSMLTTPEFDQLLRALKLSGIKQKLCPVAWCTSWSW